MTEDFVGNVYNPGRIQEVNPMLQDLEPEMHTQVEEHLEQKHGQIFL